MHKMDTKKIILHSGEKHHQPPVDYTFPIWAIIYLIFLSFMFVRVLTFVVD